LAHGNVDKEILLILIFGYRSLILHEIESNPNKMTDKVNNSPRSRLTIYWVLTGYLAFESVFSSTWDFNWINKGFALGIIEHIGFPPYFLVMKGVATLLAAPVFLLPGLRLLKEWAYFGTFIMYTGAVISHFAVGDSLPTIIYPFIMLLITIGSWALRPASRRFRLVSVNNR
jgi:DoxX-like family